jgi:hypothetical protein
MSTTTRDETPTDRWTGDAQFFEYSKAANPIGSGLTSKVPLADFPHRLHEEGPTRIVPFDLSEQLRCPGPATSPALCANFVRILAGERLETRPDATSEVYYVIRGRGRSRPSTRGSRRSPPCTRSSRTPRRPSKAASASCWPTVISTRPGPSRT